MMNDTIKKLSIFFLLPYLFINTAYPKKSKIKLLKMKVTVKKGESFADVLKRFVKDDSVIFRQEKMIDITLKRNPQIKNWKNLKTGQSMSVYLEPRFIDFNKAKKHKEKLRKKARKKERERAKKRAKKKARKLAREKMRKKIKKKKLEKEFKKYSIFYMASLGQFTQEDGALAQIEFRQNSPVTLGAMYYYRPRNRAYSISTSLYLSYLLAASSNTDQGDVTVPMEIGFNAYYEHSVLNNRLQLYGGMDFERFNTFNLSQVSESNDLEFDENALAFLTMGFSKPFSLYKRNFLFKGSLSQSVISSRTSGFSGDTSNEVYSGFKVMAFLSTKLKDRFSMSSLVKYHQLSGPSDVTILRIGMGFGYSF